MEPELITAHTRRREVSPTDPLLIIGALALYIFHWFPFHFFSLLIFFATHKRVKRNFYPAVFTLLALSGFIFLTGWILININGIPLPVALVFLLNYLIILKVFHPHTNTLHTEFVLIHLIQFFVIATTTTSFFFIPYALCFILFLTSFLRSTIPETGEESIKIFFPQKGFMLTLVTVVFIVFLLIPRVPQKIRKWDRSETTGFSKTVYLGELGGILKDDRVVFEVSCQQRGYLRGMSLDQFDGNRWSTLFHPVTVALNKNGHFPLRHGSLHENRQKGQGQLMTITQRRTEPYPVLFLPPESSHFSTESKPLPPLQINANGTVFISANRTIQSYDVFFSPPSGQNNTIPTDYTRFLSLRESSLRPYLSLPETSRNLITRKAYQLFSWKDPPEIRKNKIRNWLESEFAYSLNLHVTAKESPIEKFFTEKKGHCEYFASSFVLLLRAAGIPARLSTGFVIQEKNPYSKTYLIRNSHAHAWAEIAFPDFDGRIDWKIIDLFPRRSEEPSSETITRSTERADDNGDGDGGLTLPFKEKTTSLLRHYHDRSQTLFTSFFVNFRLSRVTDLFSGLTSGPGEPALKSSPFFWIISLSLTVMTLLVSAIFLVWYRKKFQQRITLELENQINPFFQTPSEILTILRKFKRPISFNETYSQWFLALEQELDVGIPPCYQPLKAEGDRVLYDNSISDYQRKEFLTNLNRFCHWCSDTGFQPTHQIE